MKKILIPGISIVVILLILFVPIPRGTHKDGGTKEYSALTYKVVDWNRALDDGEKYEKTCVYWGKNAYKSIDELWEIEFRNLESVESNTVVVDPVDETEHTFNANIIEIVNGMITVSPLEGEEEQKTSDRFTFSTEGLEIPENKYDYYVTVVYKGAVKESYPAQIDVIDCKFVDRTYLFDYEGTWIENKELPVNDAVIKTNVTIIQLYKNCFIAKESDGRGFKIKIDGEYPEGICVGDYASLSYSGYVTDIESKRIEAKLESVLVYDMIAVDEKPVIYLYPEEETEVSVKLDYSGELTCTYPEYNNGWTVTAMPDGMLTDAAGKEYNYLYWEGVTDTKWDFSRGFCIKGEDTAEFLEAALDKLGLTRREANEFIVFWLPLMQENEYNVISFQTDVYEEAAKLEVSPAPDTVIRVFMAFKSSDEYVDIPLQELSAPERRGFTVVEWGGTEVK